MSEKTTMVPAATSTMPAIYPYVVSVTPRSPILRIDAAGSHRDHDALAVEEPLEIRVGGTAFTVTMRTPGNDFELATGLLVTEGAIGSHDEIHGIRYCVEDGVEQNYNVLTVDLRDATAVRPRALVTTSSCGLCGKASIDEVRVRAPFDVAPDPLRISTSTLLALPDRLRSAQRGFDATGGLHAAGLFDANGELICAREDIGRHNAFDKVIGWASMQRRIPLTSHVLLASGRASFELTQKALVAGVPVLAAVSAPSTLAVRLAKESGMTLVGFLRNGSMNVYCGEDRIVITS
jgi:FdhD protein